MKAGASGLIAVALVAAIPGTTLANGYLDPVCTLEVYAAVGAGGAVAVSDPGFLADGASGDVGTDSIGGGFVATWGVRMLGFLGLEIAYDAWTHSPGSNGEARVLQAIRPGVRFFLAEGDLEPYARVSTVIALFGEEFGVEAAGGGIDAGAGVDVRLSARLSVGLDASWRGVQLAATGDRPNDATAGFLQEVTFTGTLTVHWAW